MPGNKTITASAGKVKANIRANRPSWADMKKHYPVVKSEIFYPMISKAYQKLVILNSNDWENTCAMRMSYALNYSGVILRKTPGSLVGEKHNFYYWFRVKELKKFLKEHFGGGDEEYSLTKLTFDDVWKTDPNNKGKFIIQGNVTYERVKNVKDNILKKIQGKKGIIVFDVEGFSNASGHFTLWDGNDLLYAPGHDDSTKLEYYFWFLRANKLEKTIQTVKIIFWELI